MDTTEAIDAGPSPLGAQNLARPTPLPTIVGTPPRRNPKLSRADKLAIIHKGESVIHDNQVIAHESQLPSAEEMALGDAEQTDALAASIDEEIAMLRERKSRLVKDQKPADKSTPLANPPKPGEPEKKA
jgi:hypothetical protein